MKQGLTRFKMAQSSPALSTVQHGLTWFKNAAGLDMAQRGLTWLNMVQNGATRLSMIQHSST